MAKATQTAIYPINIEKFYEAIIDYKEYPNFVTGVSSIEVLEQDDQGARVQYFINLIKEFSYIVKLDHIKPTKVSWTLESGDLFKSIEGSWELKELAPEKTEVTYTVAVDFKMFAPKMVVNKLVSKNLPEVMESMFEQAKKK